MVSTSNPEIIDWLQPTIILTGFKGYGRFPGVNGLFAGGKGNAGVLLVLMTGINR